MSALVNYQFQDNISLITLDDGKANTFSPAMQVALNKSLDQAEADGGIAILTGREGMFSAGFDLQVFQQGGEALVGMLSGGAELTRRLRCFPQPIITACSGHAMAMGLFAMLSTDYVVAVDGPFKITANEVAIGMTLPFFATETCRHRMAPAHFHRAAATAELYSPTMAVSAGMIDAVVSADALLDAARAKAQEFARLQLPAYRATKARMHELALQRLDDAIERDKVDWISRMS